MNSQTENKNYNLAKNEATGSISISMPAWSRIFIVTGALLASSLSLAETADESRRQARLDRDIHREVPVRVDHKAHRKHADRDTTHNSVVRGKESVRHSQKNKSVDRTETKRPAIARFKPKANELQENHAGRIKAQINQQQRQIHRLQKRQKIQQKKLHKKHKRAWANSNQYHRDQHRTKKAYRDARHSFNAQYERKYDRRYDNRYDRKHYNHVNNHRVFGHRAYQSLGLIYSYTNGSADNNTDNYADNYARDHHRGFVWDKIKSFYSPGNRHDYHGEELVITVNERVRTIALEGKKRRMMIDAAYVEFGNGEVRRIPEFEGTLYDNDVINFHFRDRRYVTAVYLDIAANDGRRGKASLSILKTRGRH